MMKKVVRRETPGQPQVEVWCSSRCGCPRTPLEILTCGRALERARIQLDPAVWPVLPQKVNILELRLAAQIQRMCMAEPECRAKCRMHDAAVMVQRALRLRRHRRRAASAPRRSGSASEAGGQTASRADQDANGADGQGRAVDDVRSRHADTCSLELTVTLTLGPNVTLVL